jgi:methionyl-tRNA synthetase
MAELRQVLGMPEDRINDCHIGGLRKQNNVLSGLTMSDIDALFLRIKLDDVEVVVAPAKAEKPKVEEKKVVAPVEEAVEGVITIDEFFKTQLRTAKVLKAEKVEGTDKLLKLQIEVGSETRQLVAGIALFYTPEQIIGRNIVIVANLKPAKIRGIESQGMLLAAKDGKNLKIVTVDGDIPSGSSVG